VNSTDAAYDFGVPVNGYDAASGGGWSPALPSGVGGLSGVLAGTDAIILRSAFGGGTTVTAQPGVSGLNDSSDLKVTTPNELAVGDIAIVTNCNAATVFQITGPTGCCASSNVVHNTGTGTPGNSTKALGENYAQNGGEIVKMESRAYFIRTSLATGHPALWQQAGANTAQEIADGVENMQIQYGIDTNGDGVVDSYTTAAGVANWNQVVAVRISLLVVSPDDQIATSNQTYTYNGASVTAGDNKLRQVFTTTVSVRNRTQ
jgi:type IV pilus assembly protein PilW